tara:strand:+ start:1105 stop:1704 length:600 start_codon:yes stop_codon:yes gene_type:complete
LNTGKYRKGQKTAIRILEAAEHLLINDGYQALSVRKIAAECAITPGNLQYYFPTKEVLIQKLLSRIINGYLNEFSRLRQDAGMDPKQQLRAVLTHVIKDLNKKYTTHFFPEVWALSNHESSIVKSLDEMYGAYRDVISEIILKINPSMSSERAWDLALFMTASLEGHTMFIGYAKPWTKKTSDIIEIALRSFINLIEDG